MKSASKFINVKCIKPLQVLALVSIVALGTSCGGPNELTEADNVDVELIVAAEPIVIGDDNPAAEGFDAEGSDPEAIALADEVMRSMGGRKAWDETRFLSWDFLGSRKLLWDKQTGDVRIEQSGTDLKILMNVNTSEGRVWLDSAEMTEPDSLAEFLDIGRQIWVNDSYWLIMPFKLKDTGVTLKYLGDYRIEAGEGKGAIAEVLELRFAKVGYTPQNCYRVYIPKASEQKLILQWDFYSDADSPTRNLMTPWSNYKQYGNILLSGDRGDRHLTEIGVYSNIPEAAFTEFAPVDTAVWY